MSPNALDTSLPTSEAHPAPARNDSGPLSQPLQHQAAYGVLAWASPLVVSVLVTPLIVRCLGIEGFGAYAVGLAYAGMASTLAPTRGIVNQATRARHAAERASAVKTGLTVALTIGAVSACVSAALAMPLASVMGPEFAAQRAVLFMSGALALPTIVFSGGIGSLQGLGRVDLFAACSIGSSVAASLGVALAAATIGTPTAALAAQFVTVTAASGVVAWLLSRHVDLGLGRVSWDAARPLVGFSTSAIFAQTVLSLWALLERMVLERSLGRAAVTAFVLPLMLGTYLQSAVVAASQVLSSFAQAANDTRQSLRVYIGASKVASIVAVCGAAGIAGAGEAFLRLWIGEAVSRAASVTIVPLAIAFGLNAVTSIVWFTNERDGRPDRNAIVSAAWAAIGMTVLLVLTPRLHLAGAALARLASHLVTPIAVIWFEISSSRRAPDLWRRVLTGVLPAGIALAVGLRITLGLVPQTWAWFCAVCLGGVVLYCGAVALGPALDPDEHLALRGWLWRRRNAMAQRG